MIPKDLCDVVKIFNSLGECEFKIYEMTPCHSHGRLNCKRIFFSEPFPSIGPLRHLGLLSWELSISNYTKEMSYIFRKQSVVLAKSLINTYQKVIPKRKILLVLNI